MVFRVFHEVIAPDTKYFFSVPFVEQKAKVNHEVIGITEDPSVVYRPLVSTGGGYTQTHTAVQQRQ